MARVQIKGGLGPGPDGQLRDLELADGELLAVVGSAEFDGRKLLRRLAGLESGGPEIRFGDRVISGLAPEHRNISLVFAAGALFEHLSVRENLAFGLRARGASRTEIDERVAEVSKAMLIEPLLAKSIVRLTAEDRVRVSIARGLTRHPELLLLDDPFQGLDSSTRRSLRGDFARAQRQFRFTTLLATRDAADAFALGDRVAMVERGVVRQVAPPIELYDHPADRFVAGRVGATPMNLLTLPVENGRVGIGGMSLGVPQGASVVLGIRPEEILPHATPNATLPLRAVVDLCELEGANARVVLLVNDQRVTMVCTAHLAPSEGADVTVYTDLGRLRLFSAEAGGEALDFDLVDSTRIVPALAQMAVEPNEITALLTPREETPVIEGVELTATPGQAPAAVAAIQEESTRAAEQREVREAFARHEPHPATEATLMTPPLVTESSDSPPSREVAKDVQAPAEPGAAEEPAAPGADHTTRSSEEAA